jgi:hypothetical protein
MSMNPAGNRVLDNAREIVMLGQTKGTFNIFAKVECPLFVL